MCVWLNCCIAAGWLAAAVWKLPPAWTKHGAPETKQINNVYVSVCEITTIVHQKYNTDPMNRDFAPVLEPTTIQYLAFSTLIVDLIGLYIGSSWSSQGRVWELAYLLRGRSLCCSYLSLYTIYLINCSSLPASTIVDSITCCPNLRTKCP